MLPNLLVIGAQKCGTTSLHGYLGVHPEVAMAEPKELDFFVRAEDTLIRAGNWGRGLDWYESHFPEAALVRGESSPNYTAYPFARGVPERAAEVVPGARLIYMVRDPIERIVSHYLHRRAAGQETRSLDETLSEIGAGPANVFVYRSMYFMQLERWLSRYPAERVLVVAREDLLERRLDTLRRIFGFLGVDESFNSTAFSRLSEVSGDKREPRALAGRLAGSRAGRLTRRAVPPPLRTAVRGALGRRLERPELTEERRGALQELLRPDAERLRAFTGRSFAGWSV